MKSESEDPEVGVLTIEELEELDSQPEPRPTPEYLFWYGCQRYILYLRVQIFEQTAKGEWRTIDGLKPFRVHYRQDCTFPRLIVKAFERYQMVEKGALLQIVENRQVPRRPALIQRGIFEVPRCRAGTPTLSGCLRLDTLCPVSL